MDSMDGILDTASAVHPLLPLISLLKSHGKLVMVGAPDRPLELPVFPMLAGKEFKNTIFAQVLLSKLKQTKTSRMLT